jgi:diguanylate cyclase (GGDEF)-like protein/PAS domain S-box-containing protein
MSILLENIDDLAFILDHVDQAIALFNPDRRLLCCNPKFAQVWALPLSWLQEQPHADLIWAEMVKQGYWSEGQLCAFQLTFNQIGTDTTVFTLQQSNGVLLKIDIAAAPSGRVLVRVKEMVQASEANHGVGSMVSSSDSQCFREAWQRSEERFRCLIEQAADVFLLYDLQGNIIDVNQHACDSLGYSREELLKISIQDFDDTIDLAALCQQLVPGMPMTLDTTYQRKDRSTFPAEVRLGLIELDGQLLILSLVRDVSDRLQVLEQRQKAEAALRQSEQYYRAIVETQTELVTRWLPDRTLTFANEAYCRCMGKSYDELIGHDFLLLEHESERQRLSDRIDYIIRTLSPSNPILISEHWAVNTEKQAVFCRWSDHGIFDASGKLIEIQSVGQNITDRIQTEEALRQSEIKFRTLAETLPAATFIYQDTKLLYVNPATEIITEYSQAELLSMNFWDVIHPDDQELVKQRGLRRQQGEAIPSRYEARLLTKQGKTRWVDFRTELIEYDGKPAGLGTAFDITARKQVEEQLFINAFYDSLTGLPNRALLMNRLQTALTSVHRQPNRLFAVLFIDLDRFKVVNDSLGHLIGDQLLIQISQRLQHCVRIGDTVARLGGDEFAILLEEIQDINDAIHVAERIQEQLSHPFQLQEHELFTTASVGITLSQHQNTGAVYQNLEDLLRDADIAMYRAKHRGKACHEIFDGTMNFDALSRLQFETDLHRVIERSELHLHYQPILSLTHNQLLGFEALVRWQHPKHGWIFPGEFIPLAEEMGLMATIGTWVMREACRQMKHWQSEAVLDDATVMGINVNGRQFAYPHFASQICQILEETELAPETLRLEITENVLAENTEAVAENLRQLQALGVQLCIDDFGTGYSSLSRLHQFPIDALKIDRSFIHQLENRGESWAIVKTILNLAENLGMTVIAEGIETVEQLVQLLALGCEMGQGYLFSQPLDASSITQLIQTKYSFRKNVLS